MSNRHESENEKKDKQIGALMCVKCGCRGPRETPMLPTTHIVNIQTYISHPHTNNNNNNKISKLKKTRMKNPFKQNFSFW